MDSLKLDCPAKLNLNLSVLGKRIDGMHEIKTRFQLINLFDEMVIKKTASKSISVKTNLGPSVDDNKNIVYTAIKLLSDHIGKKIYCEVAQMLLRHLLELIVYSSWVFQLKN